MSTRRKAREAALQMLFQLDELDPLGQPQHRAQRVIALYWDGLSSAGNQAPEARAFADRLVLGFAEHRAQVDETVGKASAHWRLERMARVDRNLIRMGTYELLHCDDIPRRVTINEAIEVAKRYGDEGSPAFVNGVLDRIATDVGKQ